MNESAVANGHFVARRIADALIIRDGAIAADFNIFFGINFLRICDLGFSVFSDQVRVHMNRDMVFLSFLWTSEVGRRKVCFRGHERG